MRFAPLLQVFVLIAVSNDLVECLNCRACSLDQIHIVPGDNHASVTPRITIPTLEADGCIQTMVSCDVRGIPNAVTYMTFQDNLGPPTFPRDLISTNLICYNGTWMFTETRVYEPVTQVACRLGGVHRTCGTCKPCDIVFTPKRGNETIGSHWRDYELDSENCVSLTAVCPASPFRGPTFMQFNSYNKGVMNPLHGEATMHLKCIDGRWHYSQYGVLTIVTEVNCIAV